jgi:23S rRNA pseudouridine1911/1915/1917 synthase
MVKTYVKERYNKPGNVYLGIPHRLDRPVSGVIVFARNTKAAQRLAEQFQQRKVHKVYWALVEGDVPGAEGRWEDWILKKQEEARAEVVPLDTPGAKRAVSHFRPLGSGDEGTLLEVEPETGRMHQIRVQAASRGWPVRGDLIYGSRLSFGPPAALPRERVIALHARELMFLHPIRFEPITLVAPLPPYWPEMLSTRTTWSHSHD